MTLRRFTLALLLVVLACSCSPPARDRPADSASPPVAASPAQTFPAVGIAVLDTAGRWCAAFPDSTPALVSGSRVTIVFVARTEVPAWSAAVKRAREAECPTAFAQSRWTGYRAYDLALIDPLEPDAVELPIASLAVASAAPWVRGADGRVRADLDGDGLAEEARVCSADEGQHFTLWSGDGAQRRRRAHEYFDWGAQVDPTCSAEDIRDEPVPDAP